MLLRWKVTLNSEWPRNCKVLITFCICIFITEIGYKSLVLVFNEKFPKDGQINYYIT